MMRGVAFFKLKVTVYNLKEESVHIDKERLGKYVCYYNSYHSKFELVHISIKVLLQYYIAQLMGQMRQGRTLKI